MILLSLLLVLGCLTLEESPKRSGSRLVAAALARSSGMVLR